MIGSLCLGDEGCVGYIMILNSVGTKFGPLKHLSFQHMLTKSETFEVENGSCSMMFLAGLAIKWSILRKEG